MADLRLGVGRRAALAHLCFEVREASVAAVEVQLPSWRAPLVLRARGVRLQLQQRNMPEVGALLCTRLVVTAGSRSSFSLNGNLIVNQHPGCGG